MTKMANREKHAWEGDLYDKNEDPDLRTYVDNAICCIHKTDELTNKIRRLRQQYGHIPTDKIEVLSVKPMDHQVAVRLLKHNISNEMYWSLQGFVDIDDDHLLRKICRYIKDEKKRNTRKNTLPITNLEETD